MRLYAYNRYSLSRRVGGGVLVDDKNFSSGISLFHPDDGVFSSGTALFIRTKKSFHPERPFSSGRWHFFIRNGTFSSGRRPFSSGRRPFSSGRFPSPPHHTNPRHGSWMQGSDTGVICLISRDKPYDMKLCLVMVTFVTIVP